MQLYLFTCVVKWQLDVFCEIHPIMNGEWIRIYVSILIIFNLHQQLLKLTCYFCELKQYITYN